jgi:hypothetical protein
MNYYLPTHCKVQEYVCPEIYNKYGDKSIWFMDPRILWTIDAIRDLFNKPIIINNYSFSSVQDPFKYRGLRPFGLHGIEAQMSQHFFGRAIDFDVIDYPPNTVREEILSNQKEAAFKYITALELNVNWVHIDCRNYDKTNGIFTFTA